MSALLLVLIAGLVALYLTCPHFRQVKISSARFFEETPDARDRTMRFRLSNLLLSRSFFLQLAVFLCLLLALLLVDQEVASDGQTSIGLWVAVDASASMSVPGQMNAIYDETAALLTHISSLEADSCLTISRFHLDNSILIADAAPEAVLAQVQAIEPVALGTDLSVIRALLARLSSQIEVTDCVIKHVVVLTDQPAPDWVDDYDGYPALIWRSVGTPQPSIGITGIRRVGGGALGWSGEIAVDLAGYDRSPGVAVELRDASGALMASERAVPDADDRARVLFQLPGGGNYTITLSETDVYGFDDRVMIATDPPLQLRVDWQLPDRSLPDALAWTQDSSAPDLVVISASSAVPEADVPVLVVGDAYASAVASAEIANFDETSPLLDGLNFDVAERAAIHGLTISELGNLRPVLVDTTDTVWLAIADDPPKVYVPGLPYTGDDENLQAFSTTLFFNALRWLLDRRELAPLYTLTTPTEPDVFGTRIALHAGEGNTAQVRRSVGEISQIDPAIQRSESEPVWFLPVLLAALLLVLDRYLSIFGGPRWRVR